MCEMNYFSLFCKSYLVLFLTLIIGTPILCSTITDLGIFWFLAIFGVSFVRESPASQVRQARTQLEVDCGKPWLLAKSAQTKIGCVKSFAVKFF